MGTSGDSSATRQRLVDLLKINGAFETLDAWLVEQLEQYKSELLGIDKGTPAEQGMHLMKVRGSYKAVENLRHYLEIASEEAKQPNTQANQ